MGRLRAGAWSVLAVGALLVGAACSDSSDGGGGSGSGRDAGGGGGDGSSSSDGASGGVDGATTEDGAVDAASDAATDGDGATAPFVLSSTAFAEGGIIPAPQACNTDTSPPLSWSGAPAGTQSYAVVMRDLTLVNMGQAAYHWVIYDIPATEAGLMAGVSAVAAPPTPAGAKQTHWSFSANYSYLGPCPPVGGGFHDYQFTVYSFATATIPVPAATIDPGTADAVIQANKTGSAVLAGKYQR